MKTVDQNATIGEPILVDMIIQAANLDDMQKTMTLTKMAGQIDLATVAKVMKDLFKKIHEKEPRKQHDLF